jgi:hypothetical protein
MGELGKTIVICFMACISACGGGSRASKVEYSDEVAEVLSQTISMQIGCIRIILATTDFLAN